VDKLDFDPDEHGLPGHNPYGLPRKMFRSQTSRRFPQTSSPPPPDTLRPSWANPSPVGLGEVAQYPRVHAGMEKHVEFGNESWKAGEPVAQRRVTLDERRPF